jgi:hypothetical protein
MLFNWRWSEKQLLVAAGRKNLLVPIFLRPLEVLNRQYGGSHWPPITIIPCTPISKSARKPDPITVCKSPQRLDLSKPAARQRGSIKRSQGEPHSREFAPRGRSYPDMSEYWKSTVSWTRALLPFSPTIFAQPLTSHTIAKILVQALQYLRQGYQIRTSST